jgi:hypothetical protein
MTGFDETVRFASDDNRRHLYVGQMTDYRRRNNIILKEAKESSITAFPDLDLPPLERQKLILAQLAATIMGYRVTQKDEEDISELDGWWISMSKPPSLDMAGYTHENWRDAVDQAFETIAGDPFEDGKIRRRVGNLLCTWTFSSGEKGEAVASLSIT